MAILSIAAKSKTWKVFFIALCLNLILVSAYSYIFIKVGQKNQNIAELTSAIEALTAEKENIKSIKETISETAPLRQQIDGYFIAKDGVVQFLNSIQSLGAGNQLGLKVLSVSVGPAPITPDIFELVNVGVEVSGSWSDVYRFAALVELLPFKVYLGRVDLEKVSSGALVADSKSAKLPVPPWKGTLDMGILKLK